MSCEAKDNLSSASSELSDPPSDIDRQSWPSSPATTPPRAKRVTRKPLNPSNLSPKSKRETRRSSSLNNSSPKPKRKTEGSTKPTRITKKGRKASKSKSKSKSKYKLAVNLPPTAPDQITTMIANTKVLIFGEVATAQKIWEKRHRDQKYLEESVKDTELKILRETVKYWGKKARAAEEEVEKLKALMKAKDEVLEKREKTIAVSKKQSGMVRKQSKT